MGVSHISVGYHTIMLDFIENYYQKKGEAISLECVNDEKSQEKILEAVRAIGMHMALSCIAIGILQSLSICFYWKIKFQSDTLPENNF